MRKVVLTCKSLCILKEGPEPEHKLLAHWSKMLPIIIEDHVPGGARPFFRPSVRPFLVNEEDPFRMTAVSLPSRDGGREGGKEGGSGIDSSSSSSVT